MFYQVRNRVKQTLTQASANFNYILYIIYVTLCKHIFVIQIIQLILSLWRCYVKFVSNGFIMRFWWNFTRINPQMMMIWQFSIKLPDIFNNMQYIYMNEHRSYRDDGRWSMFTCLPSPYTCSREWESRHMYAYIPLIYLCVYDGLCMYCVYVALDTRTVHMITFSAEQNRAYNM